MRNNTIRGLLGLPLHYLYYLKDFERYDGIDARGLRYLVDKYEDDQLPLARAGVAWAAKHPEYDYRSIAPYEGYPYTNQQFHHYLRRFHETLEEQITTQGYVLPVRFDQAVHYFTKIEQAAHRVECRDGLLVGMKGPLDTGGSRRLFGPTGSSMYVLLDNGTLIVSAHGPAGIVHHSSLANGLPVACAGDIAVHDGTLKAIGRRSGHYPTTPTMLQTVVDHLAANGINLSSVAVNGL